MQYMKTLWWSQIAVLVLCSAAIASETEALFDSDDVLNIELRGPLQATMKDKSEREPRAFTLMLDGREFEVTAQLRGASRVRVCSFRPLRLNFSKSDTTDSIFAGQKKLKLVTHCRNSDTYEQNVLEEYAVYRIFQLLSDVSFRTRLLRIRYIDTEEPARKPEVRYGFLIESLSQLAERTGTKRVEKFGAVRLMLNTRQAATAFVFQYLVGNTDWSLVAPLDGEICCHNGVLLDKDGSHYFVPYDFDQAGLVDAGYAKPAAEIGTRSVRLRRYRGYCVDGMDERVGIAAVEDRKKDILDLVAGLPGATLKQTKSRTGYLQQYFNRSQDTAKLLREFRSRCL